MSLVEATAILMVSSILTSVLSPSIYEYVQDARAMKAKEDVEGIGIAIVRLLKDTGFPFLVEDATVTALDRFKNLNRADLAISSGNTPAVQSGVVSGATTNEGGLQTDVSWTDSIAETDGKVSLYNQLVANTPAYPNPTAALSTANPAAPAGLGAFSLGWRGAYLNGVVAPDPWGFRYACTTAFLGTGTNVGTGPINHSGEAGFGWTHDAKCLSAGRNNQIETNFRNDAGATTFSGTQNDDVVFVVSGYGK